MTPGGQQPRHWAEGCSGVRTWTPDSMNWLTGQRRIRVKRVCNGCGRVLGDVHRSELDVVIAGGELPDVRDECGCERGRQAAS